MPLASLLDDPTAPTVVLNGLTDDSRAVTPGDAFVAVRGEASDGHDFARAAEVNGAVCILAEHGVDGVAVPVVPLAGLKERRGELAARFYGNPSRAMTCIGITGTNGKTSIAYHVADLATAMGVKSGYLGTIGWGTPPDLAPANLTTESAITTQRRLACLRHEGCAWAALEASSHALAQGRVDDVDFSIGIFSNLTRDHLDYHADLEAYGAAKRRLFEFESVRRCVLNVDDPFGRELVDALTEAGGKEVVTFGREGDVRWRNVSFDEQGLTAQLEAPWGQRRVKLPLFGEFSLSNVAAAVTALCVEGFPFATVAEAAEGLRAVPGRMEFFRQAGMPTVVVDYAHTPDALEKALAALRTHVRGRLVCVVGCGGDRDPGKRPMMALAAGRGADVVWLTSDNPRSEDPAVIIEEMRRGLEPDARVFDAVDRREAIGQAIAGADATDLVLVAGKGHEDYQEIRGERVRFSDREIAAGLLGVSTDGRPEGER